MTEGTTPAGWYDDGQGNLRWFDGTAWTEHTQPLPPATPPPAPAAPAPAAAAAPAAPAAPVAPAAAAGAGVGAVAASHQYEEHADHDDAVPFYKKPLYLILAAVVVVAALIAAFVLSQGSDDDTTTPSSSTPTSQASQPGASTAASVDPAAFGADPATIAAKANCAVSATIPASTSTGGGAQPKSKVACTLGTATYTVVTWNSAADQNAAGSLGNAFTQPVAAGTKYYATGDGWTAFDTDYSQAGAQAFATAAGGTTKGVVVVLASTPSAQ